MVARTTKRRRGTGTHKGWFDRCVAGVKQSGGADDPEAVCGSVLKRKRAGNPGKEIELGDGRHFLPMSSKVAAQTMARLLEAEGAKVSVQKIRGKWGVMHQHEPKSKSNPESDAASMFSSFHGTPSTAVDEYVEKEHYHSNLAALGELVGLKVRTVSGYDVTVGFESGRASNPRRRFNIWPFSSFSRTTVMHVPSGHKFHTETTHKGHVIYKSESKSGYVVPGIERNSVFDSVKDAKKFIDHWVKSRPNPKHKGRRRGSAPGPFASSQQFVGDTIGAIYRPMNEFLGQAGSLADKGLGKVGIKGNPTTYPKVYPTLVAAKRAWYDSAPGRNDKATYKKVKGGYQIVEGRDWNHRRSNPDHVLLCSTEDGQNLQLIGGDQSLDLDSLKIDGPLADKELVTVGEVWGLNYRTEKVFGDGGNEDGLTEYIHILGPKETKPPRGGDLWADAVPPKDDCFGTGELPTLVYDKRNQKLTLSGGMYHIDQPLMGTSAGIEN